MFEKFLNHITQCLQHEGPTREKFSHTQVPKKVLLSLRYSMSFPYGQYESYFPLLPRLPGSSELNLQVNFSYYVEIYGYLVF